MFLGELALSFFSLLAISGTWLFLGFELLRPWLGICRVRGLSADCRRAFRTSDRNCARCSARPVMRTTRAQECKRRCAESHSHQSSSVPVSTAGRKTAPVHGHAQCFASTETPRTDFVKTLLNFV